MFCTPFLSLLATHPLLTASQQLPIQQPQPPAPPPLHGRFLHITDIHPDPYYRPNTSPSSSCHRRKPKSESPRAGVYGTPFAECDSPASLINITFDWIENQWADHIDFVIWTGDSARHDNDRLIPRTPTEIFDHNRELVHRVQNIFHGRGIPIVPSLGNNDIWPHNIMTAGPNSITRTFSDIWSAFIPFPSYQIFQRGAYYTSDLIPNRLAAISLNTLYFYERNKAVGGCEWVNRAEVGGIYADAGNLQLDWLEVQLELFRERRMKVWIIGHVPPSAKNYYPECYWRYSEIVLRFQDTIVGQIFGHMNMDHFSYIAAKELRKPPKDVSAAKKSQVFESLMESFADLDEVSETDLNAYSIVHISPSVVPNPYLPSARIWGYNVTELDVAGLGNTMTNHATTMKKDGKTRPGKKRCKRKENKHKWWCQLPEREWYSDERAPSRTNGPLSPLGYVQWWIPDLDRPAWEIEYATYTALAIGNKSEIGREWRPIPSQLMPNGSLEDKLPFEMVDGTIGSWIEVARKIGRDKELQKEFQRVMYVGGDKEY